MKLKITVDQGSHAFLINTLDILTELTTVDEVNSVMEEFMAQDVMNILSKNQIDYGIFPTAWLQVYIRIIHESPLQVFPPKWLVLPILFKSLNWRVENRSELEMLHGKILEKMKNEMSLYNMLSMLFIEGLLEKFSSAYSNFDYISSKLILQEQEKNELKWLKKNIRNLGW